MAHNVKLDALSMEDLKQLVVDAQAALAEKAQSKRAQLEKELAELDALTGRTPAKVAPSRTRSSPAPVYRAPDGTEWSGRGGIPKAFKSLGVAAKEDMEQYRIKV